MSASVWYVFMSVYRSENSASSLFSPCVEEEYIFQTGFAFKHLGHSPVSASHFTFGMLGFQMHTTISGF